MAKQFYKLAHEIKPLAEGFGACIATDRILVGGCKVKFFYRQSPDNEIDSGWRFMAGDENDEYMNIASNHGVYDVNTVANYDPDIIPFLSAEVGSAFERKSVGDDFQQVFAFDLPD